MLGALRPYVNLALVTLQYSPLGLGLTPGPGVGVSVKRGGNMVAPPTPGVGVGPAAGGRPLPVTTPTTPVGTAVLGPWLHCGILQQTGSCGSTTIIQLGPILGY